MDLEGVSQDGASGRLACAVVVDEGEDEALTRQAAAQRHRHLPTDPSGGMQSTRA